MGATLIITILRHITNEITMRQNDLKKSSYGFKELATLYFPDIAPASASIRLKNWIITSEAVYNQLKETGYKRTNRILTPRQCDILVHEFGSPF